LKLSPVGIQLLEALFVMLAKRPADPGRPGYSIQKRGWGRGKAGSDSQAEVHSQYMEETYVL